jgi:hypothetical protein
MPSAMPPRQADAPAASVCTIEPGTAIQRTDQMSSTRF